MKYSLFPKLALDGIVKNKRIYLPFLVSSCFLTLMSYIIFFLAKWDRLNQMKGGGVLRTTLPLCSFIIAAFSFIFILYSNSFLNKWRNNRFGVYNVLGMNKKNLTKILFYEILFLSVAVIVIGLIFGIALSKFSELIICNLIKEKVNYTFTVSPNACFKTVGIFAGIFLLIFVLSALKLKRTNSLELIKSNSIGEKPPKANWFLAVLGAVILISAYIIALKAKQPLSAFSYFVIAIIMVIVATYLLFISGSVAVCKILQKSKKYYYKPNHFVSVSSMCYRMKRNGAGLASICILITMVLVMLGSTASMYICAESSIEKTYPRDISISFYIPESNKFNSKQFKTINKKLTTLVPKKQNTVDYSAADIYGLFTEDGFVISADTQNSLNLSSYNNVGYLQILSLENYNKITGSNKTLKSNECLIHCYKTKYKNNSFKIEYCSSLKVKEQVNNMYISTFTANQVVPTVTLVALNPKQIINCIKTGEKDKDFSSVELYYNYDFNIGNSVEQNEVYNTINSNISSIAVHSNDGGYSYFLTCKQTEREFLFSTYGGLLFIGIFFSVLFILATVIIIYYKQITEGYEDRARFIIMQKVGMTKQDIKKSINSQMLTVFFAPLIFAGLHLSFASPAIEKIMSMFAFNSSGINIIVNIACFLIYGVLYTVVYKFTTKTYYSIISNKM